MYRTANRQVGDYMEEFNEDMFKTKIDNIFVKLYTSIMKMDLSDVDHFIGDTLQSELQSKIDSLISSNKRQMYDEINVKNTSIISRNIIDDKEVIKVEIISRYMDYIIDIDSGDIISGDDTRRVEKRNILVFEKKLDTKDIGLVRKCPGCGASISVNTSGKCEYCDSIFNQEDYDYVLVSIDVN